LTADSGLVLLAVRESASGDDALIPAIDRLSAAIRRRIGESLDSVRASPPLEKVTTHSLEALRKYSEAIRAWHQDGSFSRGVALMEEAIAIDSGFAMAYVGLSVMLRNQNVRGRTAADLTRKAYERRHRLTEQERLLAIGNYHNHQGVEVDFRKALQAYESLFALDSLSYGREAMNMSGLMYEQLGDNERAVASFSRALALDSASSAVVYSNLVRAQLSLSRIGDARATLAVMGQRVPTHPRYFEARAWVAISAGQLDSARAVLLQLREARRAEPAVRAASARQLMRIARMRGQLREATQWAHEAAAADRERGEPGMALAMDVLRALALTWFLGETRRTSDSLAAALRRAPLDSAPEEERPYFAVALVLASIDRVPEARAMLQRLDIREKARDSVISLNVHFLGGSVAMADARPDLALRAFQRARAARGCGICADPYVGRAFDALAERDSARVAYERYVETPRGRRDLYDEWALAHALRRLGELYEDRDPAKAAHYYARFVTLWEHADPELQPQVREVRRRLARLAPDGR
jgi:tetratricopeptide (TPR) repeat protein